MMDNVSDPVDRRAWIPLPSAEFQAAHPGWDKPTDPPAPVFDPWDVPAPPPFPIAALPDVLRTFAEDRARTIGADPGAIAWAAISACSAAIDGRIRLQMKAHDAWTVPPATWVALVGRPSSKKFPIIDAAWEPLHRAQAADLRGWRDDLARWKALAKEERSATEPVPSRRLVSHDATMEAVQEILGRQDRGIGVLRDELAGWIGSWKSTPPAGAAPRIAPSGCKPTTARPTLSIASGAAPSPSTTCSPRSAAVSSPTGSGNSAT